MAKLWGKSYNLFNIEFWAEREKAIVLNSNSTSSIELPHCGSLRLKMRVLVTDLQTWVGLNRSFRVFLIFKCQV